jgi:hypothetical protein
VPVLEPQAYQALLQGLDRESGEIQAYRQDHGVRDALQKLASHPLARDSQTAALLHTLYDQEIVPDEMDDDCPSVPVVRHPQYPDAWGYWLSQGLGRPKMWVGLDVLEITRWKVVPTVFFEMHRQLLDIPPRLNVIEQLPDLLWELGTARLGGNNGGATPHEIWFGRALRWDRLDRVIEHIKRLPSRIPHVLLTSTPRPDDHPLPNHVIWVDLNQLISTGSLFDTQRLSQMLCQPGYVMPTQDASPVQCAPDGSWLEIRGHRVPYRSKHRLVVRQLFEGWQRGDAMGQRLKTSALLTHAGYASGTELSKVFHGKKDDWRSQIAYGQGECWLKV